jgi:hypothetical protein
MTVEVYSGPGTSAYQSTRYSATVNGSTAYVYGYSDTAVMPTLAWTAGATVAPAWFQFGADETATVAITRLAGAITSAVVYPKDKGVTQSIVGGVLTLTVPANVRLWVECNGDRVPLIIQSRPLKPALPSPRTDWTTLTRTVSSINTGTNTITCSASHGYTAGQRVVLATTGTLPAVTGVALSATEVYYVLSPSGADLKLARTSGGTEIDFTGSGTGTLTMRTAQWTDASTALYFPPGVHVTGRNFRLGNGANLYLDGGAVLVGSFEVKDTPSWSLSGAGQVFATYATWSEVFPLSFEEKINYAVINGYGNLFEFTSSPISGIMFARWPFYFTFEGVTDFEYCLGICPWNYNTDGYDCSARLGGATSVIRHSFMLCGDDGLRLESNGFNLTATDVFVVNSNGATVLLGYWGEPKLGKTQSMIDCDTIRLQPSDVTTGVALGGQAVIKLWNDNSASEAEAGWGRFNVVIDGLSVWGPFDNMFASIENNLYPFGDDLIRDGLGDVSNITIRDVFIEDTPGQLSRIYGTNWANTPHNIQFSGCEIEGVKLTAANFFSYFDTNAYPYNITVEAHPVVTEVDISNTALDLIGHAKRITDLAPPDGSAEAAICAEHYTDCVNELLDSHDWNFATVKRALVALDESDDPAWDYCYELPAGLLRVISIIPSDATDNHYTAMAAVPVDYEIHADSDDVVRIYTDLEDAWIRFVKYVTNPGLFSPTFLEALQWKLASRIAGPIIKGTEGASERDRCTGQYMMAMAKATTRDARQQRREAQKTIASWHQGR